MNWPYILTFFCPISCSSSSTRPTKTQNESIENDKKEIFDFENLNSWLCFIFPTFERVCGVLQFFREEYNNKKLNNMTIIIKFIRFFFFFFLDKTSPKFVCFFICCCCLGQSSIVLSPGDDVTHLFEGGKKWDFCWMGGRVCLIVCLFLQLLFLKLYRRHSFQMRGQEKKT